MADSVKISGLPTATTVSGEEVFPMVQSGITKQVATYKVFDAVTIPSSELLGMYFPGEEPEIPDGPLSTITYKSVKDWTSGVDGWTSSYGSVAIVDKWLVHTATGTTALQVTRSISIPANSRIRVIVKSSKSGTIYLHSTISGVYTQIGSKVVAANVVTPIDAIIPGTGISLNVTKTAGVAVGDTLSVKDVYVGTGEYSTPKIDASGNGRHLTMYGTLPVANGNYFDGVSSYWKSTNVLDYSPDVWEMDFEFPEGMAQSSNPQTLLDYKPSSSTDGFVWCYRGDNVGIEGDYLKIRYCTGSGYIAAIITSFFTGFSATAIHAHVVVNFSSSAKTLRDGSTIPAYTVRAYRNGVKFGNDLTMTTPVKPLAGSYLYIGAYQGSIYFLNAVLGAVSIFTTGLIASEIRGLSYNFNPPSEYSLTDWQNAYMLSSSITTSSFMLNTVSGYIIPYGKYEFSATSPLVQLQFLSGASWVGTSYLSGQVCADGVNARAYNPTASGVTVYYRKLDV